MNNKYENLVIDKNSLDLEVIRQSQTYYEVGTLAAEAKSRRDALYEAYKQKDAELNVSIRQEASDAGLKITDAVTAAKVLSHPEHVHAYDAYLAASLETDKLSILKEAWGNRAFMIRDLVSLYQSNYFTTETIQATNNHDDVYGDRKRRMTQNRKLLQVRKEA